ncbi:MAG: PilN domain-containing protein [Halothiobacillaceae bacterium]
MLAFDVLSNSPFPEDDTVWGYAPQGRGRVHLTIASRTHLGVWLEKQAIGDVERLEVWAGSARPVRLRGLGSERRMISERRWAQANVVALIALVGVLCLAAVLPVYQKWSELKLYERASERLAGQSSEIVQAREELSHAVARIDAARQWFGEPVAPAWLLPRLTELLPDHTMVERMEVDDGRVSLQGQSENAGALPAILGREPRFRDIRMPRAISRDARTGRERYVIEFSIDSEERS